MIAVDTCPATRTKAEALGAAASVDASLGDAHVRARVGFGRIIALYYSSTSYHIF